MNRFIKYQSSEAGNFTATRNNVTFHIPAGDYNFSESYVELSISVDGETYADEGQAGCVALFKTLGRGGGIRCPRNETMVRRVRFSTQDQMLEDIDRVDVLRQTLGTYTTDPVERLGESYKSLSQPIQYGQMSTVFRDAYTLGTSAQTARAVEAKIQIPLKDLIELGKETEMPLSQLGASKLELFLELGNVVLDPTQSEIIGPEGGFNPAGGTTAEFTAAGGNGTTQTEFLIPRSFAETEAYGDITEAGTEYPFYVGQAVTLATNAAAPVVIVGPNKIVSLIRAGDNIKVTFATAPFTTLADGSAADVVITITAPDTLPTSKVKQAAIVLSEYTQPLAKVDEIRYSTYTTELMSESAESMYRQTLLEPSAFNVFLCDSTSTPFSAGSSWVTYRLSVNNQPILDRLADVGPATRNGEHYELIGRALANGGMPFNSITEATYNMDATSESIAEEIAPIDNFVVADASTVKMIAAPVPMSTEMKPLLIELNGNAAIGQLALYKQVLRSVKL